MPISSGDINCSQYRKACLGQRVNCESVPQVVVVDFSFCIQHQSEDGQKSPVVLLLLGKCMLHIVTYGLC